MTEVKDQPAPGESWMEYFRRKKRFADLILLAWSNIEFNVNQIVAGELGFFFRDEKAASLNKMLTFDQKLRFLRENAVISKKEYSVINSFQKYRNQLFHGKDWHYFIRNQDELDKLMDSAMEAAKVVQRVMFRDKANGA